MSDITLEQIPVLVLVLMLVLILVLILALELAKMAAGVRSNKGENRTPISDVRNNTMIISQMEVAYFIILFVILLSSLPFPFLLLLLLLLLLLHANIWF
jgi:heme/copper-type cytochrome/quinol oxidase subunit 2